jgi:tetratricopeptide (TPR) repeat protein
MLNTQASRVEELRQAALARVRSAEYEQALGLYDEALALAADEPAAEDVRELLTINKADAMIALERTGPEVHALPSILMRRRNEHHVFLAAYALMFKHRIQNESKRAIFYGHVALDAANDADQPFWRIAALNDLGIIYEIDSQFEQAIECFEEALALIERVSNPEEHKLSYGTALQNLGASLMLSGKAAEGVKLVIQALPSILSTPAMAEAHIDLCFGYLELGDYEKARFYGESGLELADESRQVRNAHYLLGEACYKAGDVDRADFHFSELAGFYPEFRNLKNLLYAIDLRSMVNLKL